MRLAKIRSLEEANAFLPKFLEEFNQKFKKHPQNPINAHRPLLETQDLDRIFCLKHTRRISQNLTLQYGGTLYQIYAEKLEYTLRNVEITVLEYHDGRIHFEHNGKALKAIAYKEISAPTEEVCRFHKYNDRRYLRRTSGTDETDQRSRFNLLWGCIVW